MLNGNMLIWIYLNNCDNKVVKWKNIQQQYGYLLVSLENKEMPIHLELHEGM